MAITQPTCERCQGTIFHGSPATQDGFRLGQPTYVHTDLGDCIWHLAQRVEQLSDDLYRAKD